MGKFNDLPIIDYGNILLCHTNLLRKEGVLAQMSDLSMNRDEEFWLDEVEKRGRAYKKGKTKTYPAEEVLRYAGAKTK
jgi:hypothetical protein